jgi:hypothetical protein
MSKYQNVLAEAAYAIAGHGFAEDEIGDLSEPNRGPWQALVIVSAVLLLNVGETELAERLRASDDIDGESEFFVWVIEHDNGSVEMDTMCDVVAMPDQVNVIMRDWASVIEHYDEAILPW